MENVSTKIKPIDLSENIEIINSITSIDGAILIDENGICYAIGVILDGEYDKNKDAGQGHPGRGSRYNSTNTYVNSKTECLGIVFSEDGHINYFPKIQ